MRSISIILCAVIIMACGAQGTDTPCIDDSDCADCQFCDMGSCASKPAGTVCAIAAGVCQNPAVCDGISAICPAKTLKPSGTKCKDAGISPSCDPPDYCNGRSVLCPANKAPAGTSCGIMMSCDISGICR